MRLETIVQAAGPLQKLVGQQLPLRCAYQIGKMIDELNPELEFFGRELQKAGGGEPPRELLDYECEVEIGARPCIPLSLPIMLSPSDVRMLGPFIDFPDDG